MAPGLAGHVGEGGGWAGGVAQSFWVFQGVGSSSIILLKSGHAHAVLEELWMKSHRKVQTGRTRTGGGGPSGGADFAMPSGWGCGLL